MWQNPMGSQGLSHDCCTRKKVCLYCVEHDQENGVVSDLEGVLCQRMETKKFVTHPEED